MSPRRTIGYKYIVAEFTILQRNPDKIVFLQLHESHSSIHASSVSRIYQRQISEIHPSQAKVSAKVKGLTAAV